MTKVQDFMSQTSNHPHGGNADRSRSLTVAVFGSISKMRNGRYRLRGSLAHSSDENDGIVRFAVAYDIAPDSLPPPPRAVRPVSTLVDNVSQLLGLFTLNCEAVFEYRQPDGHLSKVRFPIPLVLQDAAEGITHIESAEFSSRSGNDVRYNVAVTPNPEGDAVEHLVELNREVPLNRTAIRALFDETVSISSRLVERMGEN